MRNQTYYNFIEFHLELDDLRSSSVSDDIEM